MKKPSNRKERTEFLRLKMGFETVQCMYSMTDKEVKDFFNRVYPSLKNKADYESENHKHVCIRCQGEVETEFHTWCGCGQDRAVYNDFDWKNDIESNDDRVDGDLNFINNGYKVVT